MSLILEALNKADQERQNTDTPPGINTVHNTMEYQSSFPGWAYFGIGVLLLALVAGTVVWWFELHKPNTPEPNTETVSEVEAPLKRSTKIPGLPKPRKVTKEPVTSITEAVTTPESPEKNLKTTVSALYEKESRSETASAADSTRSPVDSQPQAQAQAEPIPEPPQPGKPKVKTSLADFSEVGGISNLPWSIINTLPSLSYNAHDYTGPQARNAVTINNQQKSQGQKLSEGITVESILSDGVILNYKGHLFKLPALNSWVNI